MENPLKRLIPNDAEKGPDPNGLRGKVDMMKEAQKALKGGAEAIGPAKPVGPAAPAPSDKTGSQGPYGSGKGEKPPSSMPWLGEATKPLGAPKMHSGGTVTHTGPHILKKGEKVLSPEDHAHLKNAMSLAQTALSHDPAKDTEPEPPRYLREMHIKELHSGGFHVQKHDGKGGMTEHGAPHNDAVVGHFMDHMSHPDEDEEAVEAGDHDMNGTEAQEHALGYK